METQLAHQHDKGEIPKEQDSDTLLPIEDTPHDSAYSPYEKIGKSRATGDRPVSSVLYGKRRSLLTIATLGILVFNVTVILLSIVTLISRGAEQCQTKGRKKEVTAPLCVPCKEGWMEAEEKEAEYGWRRYKKADVEMCCPLHHDNLAAAVHQVYRTVLDERQKALRRNPPDLYPSSIVFNKKPSNADEAVLFTNRNKPSGHVTAVERFDATKYIVLDPNTSPDDTMLTVCDMPLRYEPYVSTTRGFVQTLTWGLVVPVSGLYRLHSTVNFYFNYPQSTVMMKKLGETGKHIAVVHQLTHYHVADGSSTVLTQRNQTISAGHTDGVTSFLVTLADLGIGDVISISVSHRSAMALQDRWHSEGLFLVQ